MCCDDHAYTYALEESLKSAGRGREGGAGRGLQGRGVSGEGLWGIGAET